MVKYADYALLCWFVFPLGFAVPTLLASSRHGEAPLPRRRSRGVPRLPPGFLFSTGVFLQGKDWALLGGSWEFVGEVSSTGSKSSAPRDASGLTLCSISPAEVNFRSCRSVEESCSVRGQGETGPGCRRAAVPMPRGMLPGG